MEYVCAYTLLCVSITCLQCVATADIVRKIIRLKARFRYKDIQILQLINLLNRLNMNF